MIIDILTLCLPIREVVRLQMSISRKIAVISVFLFGSLCVPPCIYDLFQPNLTLFRVVVASIIRFATLATLASAADYTSNMTSALFPPTRAYMMLTETEQYTLTSGATIAEIFIAIFGACVVTLGPVYRRLRYGDPQGSSSKSKRPENGGKRWGKGNRRAGLITVGTRDSFERLDGHDEGSETTIVGGGQHTHVPMRGIIVERGLEWSENRGAAC